jgi:hypothetical protein
VQPPAPKPRINLVSKLQTAAHKVALVDTKLVSFANEENSHRSSSDATQIDYFPHDESLLEHYLSEGEVLSQGEIQLGLGDDQQPDDDF